MRSQSRLDELGLLWKTVIRQTADEQAEIQLLPAPLPPPGEGVLGCYSRAVIGPLG